MKLRFIKIHKPETTAAPLPMGASAVSTGSASASVLVAPSVEGELYMRAPLREATTTTARTTFFQVLALVGLAAAGTPAPVSDTSMDW